MTGHLPMDHMTQVGPILLPLLYKLNLASHAVVCTLLLESLSENRLVVHRPHPQPDSLRNLDGGRLSQIDGPRKQQAHAVVRHVDDLPHDQAVRATHSTGRMELAPWVQPFEPLLFRHWTTWTRRKVFRALTQLLQYHPLRKKQSGKAVND